LQSSKLVGGIVSEEHQGFSRFVIVEFNAAQGTIKTLAGVKAGQHDGLVADQTGGTVDGTRIAAAGLHIRLRARNEETSGIIEPPQAFEIDIASIHDIESARFGHQMIEDSDVMHFAVADEDKRRNVAAQIQ
jgi:hypothetical protein